MVQANRKGEKAGLYVDAALDLIREHGGSTGVTLRKVSKRLGFAHTNVYNYFTDFQDLLWAAFRKALVGYGRSIADGLHPKMSSAEYLGRMLANYIGYGTKDPGLYRFISSDPLDPNQIPADIIETVVEMKSFFVDVVALACGDTVESGVVNQIANILISYLDGEALALINGRSLPGEDIAGRAVDNALSIVQRMTARTHDGIDLGCAVHPESYPVLDIDDLAETMGLGCEAGEISKGGAA